MIGNNYFGFGTDDQLYGIGYPIIKHAVFAHPGQFTPHDVEISAGPNIFKPLYEIFGYDKRQYAPGETPRFKSDRGVCPK